MSNDATGLFLTIKEAGRRFRTGELSPIELTTQCLEHVEQTEPQLHAFVEVVADQALLAARAAASALVSNADSGSLCGIPFAIKDIVDVAGLPTRCGSRSRERAAPAGTDAHVVRRLRDAKGVLIGKTVTQEFAAGTLSPPARNPWDPTRVPGGSSGGSAAAVAAGCAMTAIGTDTGGSIRNPAALCGVVGLKPTYGLIPLDGIYPLSWSLDTVGPIARTVEDAWLTYSELSPSETGGSLTPGRLTGIRLGLPRPHFFDRVDDDTLQAVEQAVETFRRLGAVVVDTPWTDAAGARACAFLINRIEMVSVHEPLLRDRPGDMEMLNADLRLRLEAGQFIPSGIYLNALRSRSVVASSIARLFTEHRLDAILAPTSPVTAVPAERPVVDIGGSQEPAGTAYTRLTQPFNATGQPVVSIPCGFDRNGLPIGLQIAGRPFQEQELCAIAMTYEQATDWHQRRPSVSQSGRSGD